MIGAQGFTRIEAIADGVEAVYTSDESKRRFEIMARQVFVRFKALVTEPAAFTYAEPTTTWKPSTRSSRTPRHRHGRSSASHR